MLTWIFTVMWLSTPLLGDAPPSSAAPAHDAALPADHEDTQSVGHPFYGSLQGGVKMPASGPFHELQPSTKLRKWTYGTGYLVRGMLRVAEAIAKAVPGGQPLVLGNLSKQHGGDIKLSVSHNSGRDIDIAYFTASPDGTSVASPYHRFGEDGRSNKAPKKYMLDLPRNWATVRALMAETSFDVQWMIVSPHIERLLLEYAESIGEPRDVLLRAERMMELPSYAKPHDNHMHVRVMCSPSDWERSCKNAGPVWPAATAMYAALETERKRLARRLSGSSADKFEALSLLRKRRIDSAVTDVAPLLADADEEIRDAALVTMLALTSEATASTVLKIARWTDVDVAVQLVTRALPLAGPEALPIANDVLAGAHALVQVDPTLSKALAKERNKELKPLRKSARTLIRSCRHLPDALVGRTVSHLP